MHILLLQSSLKLETQSAITWSLRFHHIEKLTDTIIDPDRFHASPLHAIHLFVVEMFNFVQADHTIAIQIQAAKPVLNTAQGKSETTPLLENALVND